MNLFPKDTKVSPEEKETYDNEIKMNKKSEDNNELVNNTITNGSTKEDGKDDKREKNQGSNSTEAAIDLLQMSKKTLEGKNQEILSSNISWISSIM